MPTNVIVNGDFSSGLTGWSGTDLEVNRLSRYISGGGNNRVAEIDGNRNQTTVLEQTFTLTDPSVAVLSFDVALRDRALDDAGSDGFIVEILDSDGNVLVSDTILPTDNSFTTITIPVTFPSAGDYTLRFTEIGDDDSLGALVDNVAVLICFAGDTAIDTPDGPVAARDILVGDLVSTENGPRPVRWVGRRHVTGAEMMQDERLCPVRISKGALGQGVPSRDLLVSRQHRLLVASPVAERMFGQGEVLVSAIRLVGLPGIYVDHGLAEIDYVHILLDAHEILFAESAPAESLYLGDCTRASLTQDALAEIDLIFPQLRASDPARMVPRRKLQKKMVERLSKNGRPVLQTRGQTHLAKQVG